MKREHIKKGRQTQMFLLKNYHHYDFRVYKKLHEAKKWHWHMGVTK